MCDIDKHGNKKVATNAKTGGTEAPAAEKFINLPPLQQSPATAFRSFRYTTSCSFGNFL